MLSLAGSIPRPPSPMATTIADPADPPTTTHLTWSRPVDGMRTRFSCDHTSVRVGQPIDLEFKMENTDDRTRSVLLPMVRSAILPLAKANLTGENVTSGDLMITAEQISGDRSAPPAPRQSTSLVQYGSFSLPAGMQVWITVGAIPPEQANAGRAAKFIAANRGVVGAPMMHLRETSIFPGLTRPGKYRISATFSTSDQTALLNRPGMLPDDDRRPWTGRIEAPPIEIEVVAADNTGK